MRDATRCTRVRGIWPPSSTSLDDDMVSNLRVKLSRGKASESSSSSPKSPEPMKDLRSKFNRSRSLTSASSVENEPASERSALDLSVDIISEIPTPSPMSSITMLTQVSNTKPEKDLRAKLDTIKADTLMETTSEDNKITLLLHVNKQGTTNLGTLYRKISMAKTRDAAGKLNISKLRLEGDNKEMWDGNLSYCVVVEEFPQNRHRHNKKILEILVRSSSPDVQALLSQSPQLRSSTPNSMPPLDLPTSSDNDSGNNSTEASGGGVDVYSAIITRSQH